ncbi:hypothetical protein Tco_0592843, partial [Tanacetum coccineum]
LYSYRCAIIFFAFDHRKTQVLPTCFKSETDSGFLSTKRNKYPDSISANGALCMISKEESRSDHASSNKG